MQADCVAVMQPYFVPYAGYFRLIAAADLFVIYDCVQFPRRGWVHRNRLPDRNGELQWLTLPIAKAPRDVLIQDLKFAESAAASFAQQLRRFPSVTANIAGCELAAAAGEIGGPPVDYIARLLEIACRELSIPFRTVRSSQIAVPPGLKAQDRILEIARQLGAKRYLNAPGGAELYDAAQFARSGIELRFLDEYQAPRSSILHRLASEPAVAIAREIHAQTTFAAN